MDREMQTESTEMKTNGQAQLTIDERLIEIQNLVTQLSKRQQKQQDMLDDLFEDMNTMMKPLLSQGVNQFQELEEKGYFQFLNGVKSISDNVVGHYSQQELEFFSQSIGMIMDTARSLSQPDMLTLANNVSHVLRTADRLQPVGLFGLAKATGDKEVQRGLAVAIELLKQLGQVKHNAEALPPGALGSSKKSHERKKASKQSLQNLLAPKRRKEGGGPAVQKPAVQPKSTAAAATAGLTSSVPMVEGYVFTAEGFLEDPEKWDEDLGKKIASALGFEELSETHWKLISHARQEYLKTKATPNIRALSVGSGVSTKEIYTSFPNSPAKTIAKIAGINKPVGCI